MAKMCQEKGLVRDVGMAKVRMQHDWMLNNRKADPLFMQPA